MLGAPIDGLGVTVLGFSYQSVNNNSMGLITYCCSFINTFLMFYRTPSLFF